MFYPFHPQNIFILNQQSFDLFGFLNLLVATFAACIAYRIAYKQLKLKESAEIFVRLNKTIENNWEFQIRNGCSRVLYINKIKFEDYGEKFGNVKLSRDEQGILPVAENNYYTLSIPKPDEVCYTIHMHIEFEDNFGKKYESHQAAWFEPKGDFQNGKWVLQNLRAKEIKN